MAAEEEVSDASDSDYVDEGDEDSGSESSARSQSEWADDEEAAAENLMTTMRTRSGCVLSAARPM